MKFTVIGGAIAGPAAAYALSRLGHDVTVYEQAQESDLVSAGIVGIDPSVIAVMRAYGLDPAKDADPIPSKYHIFGERHTWPSPYRYYPWVGVHKMLVNAAIDCGARFVYGTRVEPSEADGDMVIDATGIAGAARDKLPSEYSKRMIYRGPSRRLVGNSFTVFTTGDMSVHPGYAGIAFTTGDAYGQSWWTMYVDRTQVDHWGTIEVPVPPEADDLPRKLRLLVKDTPRVRATPLSHWSVRHAMMSYDGHTLVIGDADGAVAPVTTSGVSLAILEALETPVLITGTPYARRREIACLRRRDYALNLGAMLSRPQIGGFREDVDFNVHETALYGQPLTTSPRRHHEGLFSR